MSRIQKQILAAIEEMNVHLRHIHNDVHTTARGVTPPPSFTSMLEPILLEPDLRIPLEGIILESGSTLHVHWSTTDLAAPSGLHRHPGEDATYDELENRIEMLVHIGLQLYRALQSNCSALELDGTGRSARQLRYDALRAWENRFKEREPKAPCATCSVDRKDCAPCKYLYSRVRQKERLIREAARRESLGEEQDG